MMVNIAFANARSKIVNKLAVSQQGEENDKRAKIQQGIWQNVQRRWREFRGHNAHNTGGGRSGSALCYRGSGCSGGMIASGPSNTCCRSENYDVSRKKPMGYGGRSYKVGDYCYEC